MSAKLDPNKKLLSVGDVARRCGVAVSTLHFYERKGLIVSRRNTGNQRRYTRDVLRRVAVIRTAQRVGIPLSDIHAALETLPESRTPNAADWARLSQTWRAELDRRIDHLIELRDQLDGCIGCGCLSLAACPLRNPEDVLGQQATGPRRLSAEAE